MRRVRKFKLNLDKEIVLDDGTIVQTKGDKGDKGPMGIPGRNGEDGDNWPIINSSILLPKLIDSIYPIGTIYLSIISTNPATIFGTGTWVRVAEGQMVVGFLTADPDFGVVEGIGGAKTVTHTHNHDGCAVDGHSGADAQGGPDAAIKVFNGAGDLVHNVTQPTAHGDHNILNPFFVIFIWKRTA